MVSLAIKSIPNKKPLEEQQMQEAALNAVMAKRVGRVKLHLVCGDM
jgi:hypothetical protein